MADEAYNAGRDAYRAGVDFHDNPYTPLSPDWNDWKRGWTDAQEDDDGTSEGF
ncbi:hypothetical protein [Burkholderia ubonensis]|uniref:hypothetical protein n=1 Tax=Burkholderia ubonensis TaxID=101571 RepID=UPI000A5128BD|nr:hypothetical protein [Burkholderia ubonensis]